MIEWFCQQNTLLCDFANKASNIVEEIATMARNDPKTFGEIYVSPYTRAWYETCLRYADGGDANFLYTRYGYAVEVVACSLISNLGIPLNCMLLLQAGRGHTRPDIIIQQRAGTFGSLYKDIGWFDITSADSLAHIYNKTGSGWKKMPYVAEFHYTPLDASLIGSEGADKALTEKIRKAAEQDAELRRLIENKAAAVAFYLHRLADEVLVTIYNQATKKDYTRDLLKTLLRTTTTDHPAFHSIVDLGDFYDIDFGYNGASRNIVTARILLVNSVLDEEGAGALIEFFKGKKESNMEIESIGN